MSSLAKRPPTYGAEIKAIEKEGNSGAIIRLHRHDTDRFVAWRLAAQVDFQQVPSFSFHDIALVSSYGIMHLALTSSDRRYKDDRVRDRQHATALIGPCPCTHIRFYRGTSFRRPDLHLCPVPESRQQRIHRSRLPGD